MHKTQALFLITHLNLIYFESVLKVAKSFAAGFASILIDISVETAIQRNTLREGLRRVPEDVIRRMHQVIESPGITFSFIEEVYNVPIPIPNPIPNPFPYPYPYPYMAHLFAIVIVRHEQADSPLFAGEEVVVLNGESILKVVSYTNRRCMGPCVQLTVCYPNPNPNPNPSPNPNPNPNPRAMISLKVFAHLCWTALLIPWGELCNRLFGRKTQLQFKRYRKIKKWA